MKFSEVLNGDCNNCKLLELNKCPVTKKLEKPFSMTTCRLGTIFTYCFYRSGLNNQGVILPLCKEYATISDKMCQLFDNINTVVEAGNTFLIFPDNVRGLTFLSNYGKGLIVNFLIEEAPYLDTEKLQYSPAGYIRFSDYCKANYGLMGNSIFSKEELQNIFYLTSNAKLLVLDGAGIGSYTNYQKNLLEEVLIERKTKQFCTVVLGTTDIFNANKNLSNILNNYIDYKFIYKTDEGGVK